ARGQEVAGRAARRGNGVWLAFSYFVDMHLMTTGREDSGGDRLYAHAGLPIVENERRIGDGFAFSRFQVRRKRASRVRRTALDCRRAACRGTRLLSRTAGAHGYDGERQQKG